LVDGIRSEHDEASLYDCLIFLRGSLRSIVGRELGKAGAHGNEAHAAACVQYQRAPWVGTKRIDRFPIRELVLGRNERPRSDELILERFLLTDCVTWHEGEAQCGNCRDTEHVTPIHHIPPFALMCVRDLFARARCEQHMNHSERRRGQPRRRRAWLRIFVVRCGLPCDPPVGVIHAMGESYHAFAARSVYEIKHDGFRVIARRSADRVKLYSWPGIRPTVRGENPRSLPWANRSKTRPDRRREQTPCRKSKPIASKTSAALCSSPPGRQKQRRTS